MAIEKDILDQLLVGRDPQEVFSRDGLVDELKRALSERILNTELDEHLGDARKEGWTNRRNGSSQKTMLTGTSKVTLDIPRDRAGLFEPALIARYQRRFPEFDDKIVSMYARGMTVREIRGHLEELYGIDVSPDLISAVTDAVLEEVAEWQNRPLDACYPLVFFDALRVKIRDEGFVRNKAVYIALGILPDGTKEILGLWIEQTEGAKFWLRVMNELKAQGIGDILIAVTDGLKGFPDAITAVFPQTVVQTCIVHLIRHSLEVVSWKDRKAVVPALRAIYQAKDAAAGEAALDAFEASPWGQKYPAITQSWRRVWDRVIPFYAFPEGVRRIIYTTNAIEALNSKLRRAVRTRGHFPSDDAAAKLLYLVLNRANDDWKRPPGNGSRRKPTSPSCSANASPPCRRKRLPHRIPDSLVTDQPRGPKEPHSTTLSVEQEAMIVAFRRHTRLPLDDCLYALQPSIPGLIPTALACDSGSLGRATRWFFVPEHGGRRRCRQAERWRSPAPSCPRWSSDVRRRAAEMPTLPGGCWHLRWCWRARAARRRPRAAAWTGRPFETG